ncbi:MAG: histidine--tRNA ligase, partial [Xanthobacteraceae bacterium]
FEPVETPAIEYTDALGKFLPDQDRPNEGVFSFQDDDEQWLSLRYDLTAPLARYVAENFDTLPKPYRSYRVGWVFRNEKPGPGRFRQFMQFDADTVGSASPAADAEMCMMAADTMEALGIPRGSYVVKIWSRKLLDGELDAASSADKLQRLRTLRAKDKRDRVGLAGVQLLMGPGRADPSGDFTTGAGLSNAANNFITSASSFMPITNETFFIYSSDKLLPQKIIDEMEKFDRDNPRFDFDSYEQKLYALHGGRPLPDASRKGLNELREVRALVDASGYSDRIRLDPTIVRGLEYYTGPVFEVDLTFSIVGDDRKPVRFGSVGGGGRYDGLVSRFRGEAVPATGFSIGVSRLAAALQHIGKNDTKPEPGPVVVTVFDKDRLADYHSMVAKLRAADIRAELYLGNPRNFGNQLKYADRRNAPCVVIQGSDEKANGEVTIKDLIVGAELAKLEKGREEHLQKQAEAQRSVPEFELVTAVREVLAQHGLAPAAPNLTMAKPARSRTWMLLLGVVIGALFAVAGFALWH